MHCIATVTAFLVTAAPRLFPDAGLNSMWVWLLPTIVIVPWQIYFIRKYEKQFRPGSGGQGQNIGRHS